MWVICLPRVVFSPFYHLGAWTRHLLVLLSSCSVSLGRDRHNQVPFSFYIVGTLGVFSITASCSLVYLKLLYLFFLQRGYCKITSSVLKCFTLLPFFISLYFSCWILILLAAKNFNVVQKKVAELIKGRILVGHALHNDLKVSICTNEICISDSNLILITIWSTWSQFFCVGTSLKSSEEGHTRYLRIYAFSKVLLGFLTWL